MAVQDTPTGSGHCPRKLARIESEYFWRYLYPRVTFGRVTPFQNPLEWKVFPVMCKHIFWFILLEEYSQNIGLSCVVVYSYLTSELELYFSLSECWVLFGWNTSAFLLCVLWVPLQRYLIRANHRTREMVYVRLQKRLDVKRNGTFHNI